MSLFRLCHHPSRLCSSRCLSLDVSRRQQSVSTRTDLRQDKDALYYLSHVYSSQSSIRNGLSGLSWLVSLSKTAPLSRPKIQRDFAREEVKACTSMSFSSKIFIICLCLLRAIERVLQVPKLPSCAISSALKAYHRNISKPTSLIPYL